MKKTINIEIVFGLRDEQMLQTLCVDEGMTAGEALLVSDLARSFPVQNFGSMALGVWGHPVDRDRLLRDGDRLEIYRALEIDPREARRQLALGGLTMGQPSAGDD